MEQTNYDIHSVIRLANRQRSDALGEFIVAGWSLLHRRLAELLSQRATGSVKRGGHFPWLETPT
jgi:hypothetical protein